MTAPYPRLLPPAQIDWPDGQPRSRSSGDIYFSRHDGVAETRSVFIAGNDLPTRFAALAPGARFCIGETGFGTGLNFLVARRAFLDHAPAEARLEFVSVEHAPVAEADLLRCAALIAATGHRDLADALNALAPRMPPPVRGWHRLAFDATEAGAARVQLSLWLGDAASGFDDWLAQRRADAATDPTFVDAWFLDGFAPGVNPELWSAALLRRVAALSAPTATLATFSVARSVREALMTVGFVAQRVPGPEGKREVLRAIRGTAGDRPAGATSTSTATEPGEAPAARSATAAPGSATRTTPGRRARQVARTAGTAQASSAPLPFLVLGAGLAGASTAAALARRGHPVVVCDPMPPARGASGNPWAVLHPRLPMDDGPRAAWLLIAHHHAWQWLEAFRDRGWDPGAVLQVPEARRPERMARLLERFADLAPGFAATTLGGAPALRQLRGGCADLPRIVAALLDHPCIRMRRTAGALRASDGRWQLLPAADSAAAPGTPATGADDRAGEARTELFDAVVVAAGHDSGAVLAPWLPAGITLPLGRMRGQVSRFRPEARRDAAAADPGVILTGRGYALVQDGAWISGSSYVRDGDDGPATASEREENHQRLRAWFAYLDLPAPDALRIDGEFCGVRANLPDRVPAVGRVAPGLWVNAGHASSGLTTCPLAAEHLAASLTGEPPVLGAELRALLDPLRFPASGRTA